MPGLPCLPCCLCARDKVRTFSVRVSLHTSCSAIRISLFTRTHSHHGRFVRGRKAARQKRTSGATFLSTVNFKLRFTPTPKRIYVIRRNWYAEPENFTHLQIVVLGVNKRKIAPVRFHLMFLYCSRAVARPCTGSRRRPSVRRQTKPNSARTRSGPCGVPIGF